MKNLLEEFGTYDPSTGLNVFSDVRSGLIVAMVCFSVICELFKLIKYSYLLAH